MDRGPAQLGGARYLAHTSIAQRQSFIRGPQTHTGLVQVRPNPRELLGERSARTGHSSDTSRSPLAVHFIIASCLTGSVALPAGVAVASQSWSNPPGNLVGGYIVSGYTCGQEVPGAADAT